MGRKGAEEKAQRKARKRTAKLGKRLRTDLWMREFRPLGWTVILVPLDLFESRFLAGFFVNEWYGFASEDIHELRARRVVVKGKERTFWLFAIPCAVTDARRERVAAKRVEEQAERKAAKKAKKKG